jgi:uncharacterized protein YbjT (DUF2867 family)
VPENSQSVILVTGATGTVGRHVVSQLLRTGLEVRALTRNPTSTHLPDGVDVVRGDLSDPDTLHASLDGVQAVFLVWPGLTVQTGPAVLDVVAKHARRIVFLSSLSIRDDVDQQADPITDFHADMEHLIEQSGLQWTFLRASGFATNTLRWAPQIRADGVVRWVYAAAARSLIHEQDIAAVAVRALTGDGHGGAKYVLTGPQALTQAEQVRTIGEVIGRPLRYEEISPEAGRRQLLAEGWPPSFVAGALNYWAKLVTEPELVTPTVEELTGVPARTFREWAIDHAGDFRS